MDPKRISEIFRIGTSPDEAAASKISSLISRNNLEKDTVKKITKIFLDTEGGIKSAEKIIKEISDLFAGSEQNKKIFNSMIEFYSTAQGGFIDGSTAPYLDVSGQKIGSIYGSIIGKPSVSAEEGKKFSIIKSITPFISLTNRDTAAVEVFLNFIPPTFFSRCVPYCDVEFIFDRPVDAPDNVYLRGPSLVRLTRDDTLLKDLGSADRMMSSAREFNFKSSSPVDKKNNGSTNRVRTSSGMEIFLAPQSLVNFGSSPRTNPVLDRTRPLISVESISIVTVPNIQLVGFKQATMNLKIHDRTRLSEFAEILQPYGTNRISMWLTYGWRHPTRSEDTSAVETYGRFINEKMMVKECYNLKNASFSFDASGQVSIVCELYTKGLDEFLSMTMGEFKGFDEIRRQKEIISKVVSEFMREFRVSNVTLGQKEVRPLQILGAAANGTNPSFEATDIPALIKEVVKSLRGVKSDAGKTPTEEQLNNLEKNLQDYYSVFDKENSIKSRLSLATEEVIKSQFESLSSSSDPFILTEAKIEAKKKDVDDYVIPDYWDELKKALGDKIKTGSSTEKAKIVSFGKLFCTFVEPIVNTSPSFDEVQVYFYCLNDYAGKASRMNIADFPLVLNGDNGFLNKYREFITKRASSVVTINEFLNLVTNSQIKNLASIPYGFTKQKDHKEKDIEILSVDEKGEATIKNQTLFETTALNWNKGRGGFQIPKIVAYCEVIHEELEGLQGFDKLAILEKSTSFISPTTITNKILRIHVLDETANVHATKISAIRNELPVADNTSKVDVESLKKGDKLITKSSPGTRSYRVFESTTSNMVKNSEVVTINNRESLIRAVARDLPILVPGQSTSGILEATMTSKADPTQKAAIMTGHKTGRELQGGPRGTDMGEFPIQIVPSELQMKTIGCPLVSFAQSFFVDLNTGTTIDNVYNVSGFTHSITPGKFETSVKMSALDSYAKYRGADDVLKELIETISAARAASRS